MKNNINLTSKNLLELLVLKMVAREPYPAASILDELARNNLTVPKGTLYPLMSELREKGLVVYSLEELDVGPMNKCYSLTDKGRRYMGELLERWKRLNKGISTL